ncbi:MAG: molybdopterin-synthase adenylyltransferase MoeB [Thermoleophilia bacterium]|jgi:molybdopterin/thiamine biosynthesis adenylyltransferase/rhodanese-related sulfurtransferase|nr:molybdopterin-synthase adenylyltransferase MoeB [Thermoleophilia bacterium]
MPTGAELIETIKAGITEVQPSEANDELAATSNGGGVALVDVREQHEFEERHIPGAIHVPRGHLESRIEQFVPDKSRRVILYCASGNRSAFAAKTLTEQLGYSDVASMAGGITLWKDRNYETVVPRKLTQEQKERYSRHILVPEIGLEGQLKLLDAKVLLLGAGGLGSPTALYLAAAGVGTIGLVDDDEVDASNLQRQVIHSTETIGIPKTESARRQIEALNPDVTVNEHRTRLDSSNVIELLSSYDIIVDGADNFPTRYLLNDASVRLNKPVVSASILAFDGQISTFVPHDGPCYRCLYPTPPPPELAPSCGAAGVLGMLPGVMGLMQSLEVFKLITGAGEPLVGRLLLFEALSTTFTELKVRKDPSCPICGPDAPQVADEDLGKFPDYEAFCSGVTVA